MYVYISVKTLIYIYFSIGFLCLVVGYKEITTRKNMSILLKFTTFLLVILFWFFILLILITKKLYKKLVFAHDQKDHDARTSFHLRGKLRSNFPRKFVSWYHLGLLYSSPLCGAPLQEEPATQRL